MTKGTLYNICYSFRDYAVNGCILYYVASAMRFGGSIHSGGVYMRGGVVI